MAILQYSVKRGLVHGQGHARGIDGIERGGIGGYEGGPAHCAVGKNDSGDLSRIEQSGVQNAQISFWIFQLDIGRSGPAVQLDE